MARAPRPPIVVSRDDLCLMTPNQLICPASLVGNSRETFHKSGTDGSNPVPSSGESSELRFGLTCSKGLGSAAIAERSTRDLSAQTQSDDSAHPREGGLGGGIEPIACESFVCF